VLKDCLLTKLRSENLKERNKKYLDVDGRIILKETLK
jgi:hypothetical protein